MSSAPQQHSNTFVEHVLARKFVFTAVFTAVFFLSLTVLNLFGFAPNFITNERTATPLPTGQVHTLTVAEGEGELPIRIEVPSIGVKANVANPNSTDLGALDRALLGGAVRYPGTARLGEEGNALLFGHSSHLPVVHNQAYKAFNDIQNLKNGEPIFVIGETKVYTYAVENVASATVDTGEIPLSLSGAKLTLVTCDNFGTKADRFIVTAKLVNVETLEN
jgi:LPXTG-site transpeptidase (sortase) family protein